MGRYRKYFKIYRKMQEMNIKSLMYYRADFLMMTFFTLLSQVSNLAVVGIIYTNIPTVGGWSVWEILLLDGYLLFSEGWVNFFFQGSWKIAQMVKTRIEVFPDIPDLIDFFEAVPEYDVAMYTHKKMKTNPEISLEVLNKIIPVLEAHEDYTNDALYELLCGFAKENGYKNGQILWPIRTALSGKQMTPAGATEILEVLGKDESIIRLKAAVEKLS